MVFPYSSPFLSSTATLMELTWHLFLWWPLTLSALPTWPQLWELFTSSTPSPTSSAHLSEVRENLHALFHAYKHTDSHFLIHAKSQSHTSYCSYCLHTQLLVHLYVPAVYLTKSECFMKSFSLRLASGSDRLLHSYIFPQWSLSDLQCCDSGCCESDHPLH